MIQMPPHQGSPRFCVRVEAIDNMETGMVVLRGWPHSIAIRSVSHKPARQDSSTVQSTTGTLSMYCKIIDGGNHTHFMLLSWLWSGPYACESELEVEFRERHELIPAPVDSSNQQVYTRDQAIIFTYDTFQPINPRLDVINRQHGIMRLVEPP